MAEIKDRLSTFEVDDLEQEINTLRQVIREKVTLLYLCSSLIII